MRKCSNCLIRILLSVLCLSSLLPVRTAEAAGTMEPYLSATARIGGSFRTIDLCLTLPQVNNNTRLYYLALAQHSPAPSVADIIAYAEGKKTEGLTDGTVVRGWWVTAKPYEGMTFSLAGAENVRRFRGETGFIDGYQYDVYVAAENADGTLTASNAVGKDVMAQPFAGASADGRTFTIRTVRQLQNIQRLADLYVETKCQHGSANFLTDSTYTYVLDADLDLKNENWVPIGNTDENTKFIFCGSFDGNGHTLRNLYMDKDTARDGKSYERQGLFGKTDGATIRNLTIDGVELRIAGNFGRDPFAVGVLAGEMNDGTIDHITVKNASLTAYGPDYAYGDVGGLAGCANDTHLYDIKMESSVITAYDTTNIENNACTVGGIIGRYIATESNRLLRNLQASVSVNAAPPIMYMPDLYETEAVYAGGIIGRLDSRSEGRQTVHAESWGIVGNIIGGSYTGGLAGYVVCDTATPLEDCVTFDTCRSEGRVAGYGRTGGLFGEVRAENNRAIIIKNTDTNNQVVSINKRNDMLNTALLGGLAGELVGCTVTNSLSRGAAISSCEGTVGGFAGKVSNCYFSQCYSRRDVSGIGQTGGFTGFSTGTDYQSCRVERVRVSGGYGTGGFTGLVDKSGLFYDCYSAAAVKGENSVGGFAGMAKGNVLPANAGHTVVFAGCRADGNVRASGGQAGGFAGVLAYAAVENSRAGGSVRADAPEAGGFCGRLTQRSRVSNASATGDVVNTERAAGGFAGTVTDASYVEYAYSTGNVTAYDDVGGFVGVVSAYGTPNTLTGCLSFAQRVTAPSEASPHRFAGRLDHAGVNSCYAYLGGAVVAGYTLNAVNPGAYGADGADINGASLENVLKKLNWDEQIWVYDGEGGLPRMR